MSTIFDLLYGYASSSLEIDMRVMKKNSSTERQLAQHQNTSNNTHTCAETELQEARGYLRLRPSLGP